MIVWGETGYFLLGIECGNTVLLICSASDRGRVLDTLNKGSLVLRLPTAYGWPRACELDVRPGIADGRLKGGLA